MRHNEQFYTDGCGIMIDGGDDVRFFYRGDYHGLATHDEPQCAAAEVHFMDGSDFDFAGVLKVNRHERYVEDLTGQPLSQELCRKATASELDYFRGKEVWTIRKAK